MANASRQKIVKLATEKWRMVISEVKTTSESEGKATGGRGDSLQQVLPKVEKARTPEKVRGSKKLETNALSLLARVGNRKRRILGLRSKTLLLSVRY
jgi:hypothetical protein